MSLLVRCARIYSKEEEAEFSVVCMTVQTDLGGGDEISLPERSHTNSSSDYELRVYN